MIQLTRNGVTGAADVAGLAEQFAREHTFRLRGLIHPDLLNMVAERLEQTNWSFRRDGDLGTEASPEDRIPADILNFAVSTPAFLETIRQISGMSGIRTFGGRVYRMAKSEHRDKWHDDISESFGRMVGMSINLSPAPYEGGVFKLREMAAEKILLELPNSGPGDAIFFRISPELQHIVTPVESEAPKTAFAGWFGTNATVHELLLSGALKGVEKV